MARLGRRVVGQNISVEAWAAKHGYALPRLPRGHFSRGQAADGNTSGLDSSKPRHIRASPSNDQQPHVHPNTQKNTVALPGVEKLLTKEDEGLRCRPEPEIRDWFKRKLGEGFRDEDWEVKPGVLDPRVDHPEDPPRRDLSCR